MNTPLAFELTQARIAEIRAAARPRCRRSDRPADPTPRAASLSSRWHARQRAGWWLVTVGLRLATGSADGLR